MVSPTWPRQTSVSCAAAVAIPNASAARMTDASLMGARSSDIGNPPNGCGRAQYWRASYGEKIPFVAMARKRAARRQGGRRRTRSELLRSDEAALDRRQHLQNGRRILATGS